MKYTTDSVSDLPNIAKAIIPLLQECKIASFSGIMGAGKTTFIKAICKELHVEDTVNSPTFSIVNEYITKTGQIIYHFDFYRLKCFDEIFDIGLEEYFNSGNICMIEWPDLFEIFLPKERLKIEIIEQENEKRMIFVRQ